MQHHWAVPALLLEGRIANTCPLGWLQAVGWLKVSKHHYMTMMHTAQIVILQVDALLWDHAHGVDVW
jgi:hypothetical protein